MIDVDSMSIAIKASDDVFTTGYFGNFITFGTTTLNTMETMIFFLLDGFIKFNYFVRCLRFANNFIQKNTNNKLFVFF
jgi:hypothetical protein